MTQRPFYVIGAMASTNQHPIHDVEEIVNGGGNAIEFDIVWHDGKMRIGHGPLLPGINYDLQEAEAFLADIGVFAKNNPQLVLVLIDCHVHNRRLGSRILQIAREKLPSHITIIFSHSDAAEAAECFAEIGDQLRAGAVARRLGGVEGIMVDKIAGQDAAQVADLFVTRGMSSNACYGMGNMNDNPHEVEVAIDHAVALKLQERALKWVYIWTLIEGDDMRDAIRAGVDGILAEHDNDAPGVKRLAEIIKEPEFVPKVRLATAADDPFAAIAGYTIAIHTMNRQAAGTDANITFTLKDKNGVALSTTIDGSRDKRFEQGNVNEISLFGDIGEPFEVTVEHDGTGQAPDWLPDVVQVRRTGDANVYAGGFKGWVKKGTGQTAKLGNNHYLLKVTTADKLNAGTDADIVFTIHGTRGDVNRRVIAQPRDEKSDDVVAQVYNPFERDSLDSVFLSGLDVGVITAVSVSMDIYHPGNRPDWLPKTIEVFKDRDPGIAFDFTGKWLKPGGTVTAP